MVQTPKQVIGEPVVINGRQLSLSRAVRAGDFVFLTGQIPMRDGKPMTSGSIEDQTRACLESIRETLELADCGLEDIVKTMVWPRSRAHFPGFAGLHPDSLPKEHRARAGLVRVFLLNFPHGER